MTTGVELNSDEILARVEHALNGLRPYLEADGGNIRVLEFTPDQIVRLEFLGNCGNCPMSSMTFRAGVEEAIRREVPEVRQIEVVNLTVV